MTDNSALHRGRLTQTLVARHGPQGGDPEPQVRIEHRQALIYTLAKAAELEHLIICQYLFAAFSLKKGVDEGLTEEQATLTKGWARTLFKIAEQEMLHLALVQNLLIAVGAAPHFSRPNFPVPPRAFPARIQIALLPLNEESLRHFAYLERPEGEPIDDTEAFAALAQAAPLPQEEEDQIGPITADFETISHLYRSIEDGLTNLSVRMGEAKLFIGPPRAQADGAHFRFAELIEVVDLATARQAIDTIVEQGEGARGDWKEAHFGRLLSILDEFIAAREADPTFEPTRPVVPAYVRPPESGVAVALISRSFSVRATDLLNAVYEVTLQVLARYFNQTVETEEDLAVLAHVGVGLMEDVIGDLGEIITRLPVGADHPGRTVGPAFELFYDADWLLPHRDAAWQLIVERLQELAAFGQSCRLECPPGFADEVAAIADKLRRYADKLTAAA